MTERTEEAHTAAGSDALSLSEPAESSAVTALPAARPAAPLTENQTAPLPSSMELEAGVSPSAAMSQANHSSSRQQSRPEQQASEVLDLQSSPPSDSACAEESPAATSGTWATGLGTIQASSSDGSKLLWGELGGQALPGMSAQESDRFAAVAADLEDGAVSDDAPVSVVVDECLVQPIRAHYLCVSGICLRYARVRVLAT